MPEQENNPIFTNNSVQPVGIDLETGGLNGYVDIEGERLHGALYYPILEVGLIIPTKEYGERATISVGIKQTPEHQAKYHKWALKQHVKSGLLERLRTGEDFDYVADTVAEAEQYILVKLAEHGVERYHRKNKTGAVAFGNNVSFDMEFLNAQMPELAAFFSYRKIDVSSINMLSRCFWQNFGLPEPEKELKHTAVSDIRETLAELRSYSDIFADMFDRTAPATEELPESDAVELPEEITPEEKEADSNGSVNVD